MKKTIVIICVVALMLSAAYIGTTYALLSSKSLDIVNTFVVGEVTLTLTESTGSNYVLVPGVDIKKDPEITVGKKSEDCWLFFKLECEERLENLIDYSIEDGWIPLSQEEGVYWRRVSSSVEEKKFGILKDDKISVKGNVTEEMLAEFLENPKLVFTAYAVQDEGVYTEQDAWEKVKPKGDES